MARKSAAKEAKPGQVLWSSARDLAADLFRDLTVQMTTRNRLMAGVPSDPKLVAAWLESRGLTEKVAETLEQVEGATAESDQEQQAVADTAEANVARLVFKRHHDHALMVSGYTVKAHLKDAANVLKTKLGIKALKSKFADRAYVLADEIILRRPNGESIRDLDGSWEHAIQIMTRQGPRSAIKANDFLEPPVVIEFTLRLVDDKQVIPDMDKLLVALLSYGGLHGYGPERSLGFGRYDWQVIAK